MPEQVQVANEKQLVERRQLQRQLPGLGDPTVGTRGSWRDGDNC